MKYLAFLMLVSASLAAVPALDSGKTTERTVTKLAEGIYTIRHKDAPDTFPQGNTTVIIGDREVLVVDSCYLPSSAREDIEQIRRWTTKPVRYLVNTHWHYDHTMGNGAYAEAFPGLAVVAHEETARQSVGYNPGWFERYPNRAATFRARLESGKNADGRPLTEVEKKDFASALAGVGPVAEEFKKLSDRAPTLTFDRGLTVDLGNREVRVMHLGRGNTAGDAIIFLPKEKIIMTGDLVVHPVPYMFGGYPSAFGATLRRLDQLGFDTMVPGHGEILRAEKGRAYAGLLIEFIEAVTQQVSA